MTLSFVNSLLSVIGAAVIFGALFKVVGLVARLYFAPPTNVSSSRSSIMRPYRNLLTCLFSGANMAPKRAPGLWLRGVRMESARNLLSS